MSEEDSTQPSQGKVKTLAIRLEADLHAQLSVLAQLNGSTITDEIRTAIERHIGATKASPELSAKADAVLEDIERDAASRREAIAALFGNEATPASSHPSRTGRRTKEPPAGS